MGMKTSLFENELSSFTMISSALFSSLFSLLVRGSLTGLSLEFGNVKYGIEVNDEDNRLDVDVEYL